MKHNKQFFFSLGRMPHLSINEILAVFRSQKIPFSHTRTSDTVFVCAAHESLDLPWFQKRLGGTIKIGVIDRAVSADSSFEALAEACTSLLETLYPAHTRRCTFGISASTLSHTNRLFHHPKHVFVRRLGVAIKKRLKEKAYSTRFVLPQTSDALSSVVVEKNKLLYENGAELFVISTSQETLLGHTCTVQDFSGYSHRDWARPSRDMETGMLPPKIAQAMLNLTGLSPDQNPFILDPFCGMGTIVQEALVMGFSRVYGSDINSVHVAQTQENIAWLTQQTHTIPHSAPSAIRVMDARLLHQWISPHSVDAIVSEPYLGPRITRTPSAMQAEKIARTIVPLMRAAFHAYKKILKTTGRVVTIFPAWKMKKGIFFLPCDWLFSDEWDIVPLLETHERKSLLLSRPHHSLIRELWVVAPHKASEPRKNKRRDAYNANRERAPHL